MKNLSNKSLLAASAMALLAIGVAANAAAQQRRRAAVRPTVAPPVTSNSGPGGVVVSTTPLNPMSPTHPKPVPTTIPPDF